MSAAGVAVSLVNFLVAVGKDPADYYNAFCRSNAPTASAVSVKDQDVRQWLQSSSCQSYNKVDGAIFLYFLLGILVLLLCLIGFSYVHNVHISEDDDAIDGILRRRQDATYETIQTIEDCVGGSHAPIGAFAESSDVSNGLCCSSDPLQISTSETNDVGGEWLMASGSTVDTCTFPNHGISTYEASFVVVWNCVQGPAVCIFLTFFITLGLFPGWTSVIQSVHQCQAKTRFAGDLFVPSSFLLFNVGDFMGRWWAAGDAARHYLTHPPEQLSAKLVRLSVLRFGLFPLLFLCHTGSDTTSSVMGWVIHSDLYAIVVQWLLATSNGFLISTAFLHASSRLSDAAIQGERMSAILSLAVSLGLLCGSLLSVGVARWVA
jgi:Nucleoside transporter